MNFAGVDLCLACHRDQRLKTGRWGCVNLFSLEDKSILLLVWWWTIHSVIEHVYRKCTSFKTCSELGWKWSLTNDILHEGLHVLKHPSKMKQRKWNEKYKYLSLGLDFHFLQNSYFKKIYLDSSYSLGNCENIKWPSLDTYDGAITDKVLFLSWMNSQRVLNHIGLL